MSNNPQAPTIGLSQSAVLVTGRVPLPKLHFVQAGTVGVVTLIVLSFAARCAMRSGFVQVRSPHKVLNGIVCVSLLVAAITALDWRWLIYPARALGALIVVMGLIAAASLWHFSPDKPVAAAEPTSGVDGDKTDNAA